MTASTLVKAPSRVVLRGWRRLTSMRTALILLFLLAVAAVPGSLLPQRPLGKQKVTDYITAHGSWGDFLNSLGMFDVFGSPWFAAIYLLLFVSLVGCLIPRIRVHARAVARKPLPAPRHLGKLPASGRFEAVESPADYVTIARQTLGRRWRVAQREEPGGAITLSAEKGYSRETGNLVFHVALLLALVLVAVGRLYSYEGSLIKQQGQGFCNAISQYDNWKPGRFAADGDVSPAPFCITNIDKFTATYAAGGEASNFQADVTYSDSVNGAPKHASIKVNHPLRLEGDRVYLLGHGFAPRVTITLPDGRVVHDVANFIPTDQATLQSEGVFKEPGADSANQDIGLQGIFAPTAAFSGPNKSIVTSTSPQPTNPVLGLVVWQGNLSINGLPQSIYTLDTGEMKKLGRVNLRVGQSKTFAGGVTVRFDGYQPWVSIQISHDPAQSWLLLAAGAMVVGLLGSLGIRRRRVWLRATPSSGNADGSLTVVSVGGLARSDSGNFGTEFESLLERLRTAGRPAAERIPPGEE